MADFLTTQKLEDLVTRIIGGAKDSLLLLAPTLRIDAHFRTLLERHRHMPQLHIIFVFGNAEPFRAEDLEPFRAFPKVSVLHLKELNACYYASESESVLTSLRLDDAAFRNRVDFGIGARNPNQSLLGLTTLRNPFSDAIDSSALEYATSFMRSAEAIFIRRPLIKKKLFGLSTDYLSSATLYDNSGNFAAALPTLKKTFDDFPDLIDSELGAYVVEPQRLGGGASGKPAPQAEEPAAPEVAPAIEPPLPAPDPAPASPGTPPGDAYIPKINYGKEEGGRQGGSGYGAG